MVPKRKSCHLAIITLFCVAFLLLPLTSTANFTVSGRIVNTDDGEAITNAAVFLNNSLISAATNSAGTFILNGVKSGQYDLIVALKGYKTYQQTITVTGATSLPDIDISLNGITINDEGQEPNTDFAVNYKIFKRFLFGQSIYSDQCKILNPGILKFQYDSVTLILTAKADKLLTIENLALGYRIKFLLTNFSYYLKSDTPELADYIFFEEMDGSPAQKAKWQTNRLNIYEGSAMNFFCALAGYRTRQVGFRVFRVAENVTASGKNKNSKAQTVKFKSVRSLELRDMVKQTAIKGRFALIFRDSLYVAFRKDHDKEITNPLQNRFTTMISLISPYAYFDNNGIIINPDGIAFKGYWKEYPLPELLPFDFEPASRK
jgi:hypothetical protein